MPCAVQHTFLLDAYQYQFRVHAQDVPHIGEVIKK